MMTDAPLDQAAEKRIMQSFAAQGLMTALGARLGRISSGEVQIFLPMSDRVTQQHGYFHAGATSAIADSAGGYATLTLFDDSSEVLTVEYKINLVAPARGEELEAVGTVLKFGRTLTICRLDVFAHSENTRTLVAAGQQTIIRIDA